MLIQLIWILFILQRVWGNDEACDYFSACADPETFPMDFPENESELNASCSILLEYMPCVRNYEQSCRGSYPYEEQYNKVYGTLTEICDQDSSLHTQLSNNIMCIKNHLYKHNDSCTEEKDKIIEAYVSYVQKDTQRENEKFTVDDWDIIYCLQHSQDISCYLSRIEDCGNEVRDISVYILKNSGFNLDGCPDNVQRTILFLLNNLELPYYQEKSIKEVLQMSASEHYEHENISCMARVFIQCQNSGDVPEDLPGNEEELNEACKYMLGYFDCAQSIVETCKDTDLEKHDLLALAPIVTSVCDNDSLLFSAVAESLGCFKTNRDEISSCHLGQVEIDLDTFSDTLSSIGITNVPTSNSSACLGTLYRVSCSAANTGKICGDVARDVLLNLVQRFVSPFASCPGNVKEKIPDIVSVWQIEKEKTEDVENVLKRKK